MYFKNIIQPESDKLGRLLRFCGGFLILIGLVLLGTQVPAKNCGVNMGPETFTAFGSHSTIGVNSGLAGTLLGILKKGLIMLIKFDEYFDVKPEIVYSYFKTPADWPRLFLAFGKAKLKDNDWYVVPFRNFPLPLIAKTTRYELNKIVAWKFKGFWRGDGEVKIEIKGNGVQVRGYEKISLNRLLLISPIIERLYLKRRFNLLWVSGWRKMNQMAKENKFS